ncbi:MAG TPA: hypothetical protein VMV18_08105 [bacterium]|nr:hypothetical protein [bacterium]
MKKILLAAAALSLSATALAAEPKTYQKTAPVVAVSDDMITLDTGKDGKWEIAKNADTKLEGGDAVKVGDKVTVTYRMTAAKIEVKGGAKADGKKGAKADKPADAAAAPAAH